MDLNYSQDMRSCRIDRFQELHLATPYVSGPGAANKEANTFTLEDTTLAVCFSCDV